MRAEDTRTPAPNSSELFGISEVGMLRIFEGVKIPQQPNRSGEANHYLARGFHLEDPAIMAAHGHIVDEHIRTSPDSRGVYRVRVLMFGAIRRHGEGFFPRGWTREQVIAAIGQAYINRQPFQWGAFKRGFKGVTETGMRIVMELDESGLVLDAFPLRAKINPRTEALWRIEHGLQKRSRHVCQQCGRLKVLHCPAEHKV